MKAQLCILLILLHALVLVANSVETVACPKTWIQEDDGTCKILLSNLYHGIEECIEKNGDVVTKFSYSGDSEDREESVVTWCVKNKQDDPNLADIGFNDTTTSGTQEESSGT